MNTKLLLIHAVPVCTRFVVPTIENPLNKPELLNHHKKRKRNE